MALEENVKITEKESKVNKFPNLTEVKPAITRSSILNPNIVDSLSELSQEEEVLIPVTRKGTTQDTDK
jgi:hypothetical protein